MVAEHDCGLNLDLTGQTDDVIARDPSNANASCGDELGIGVVFACQRERGHHGPHRYENYGGLYRWWQIEWGTTPEAER